MQWKDQYTLAESIARFIPPGDKKNWSQAQKQMLEAKCHEIMQSTNPLQQETTNAFR